MNTKTLKLSPMRTIVLLILFGTLVTISISQRAFAKEINPLTKPASVTATAIVELLSKQDWVEISKLVHPKRGLRFSPYVNMSDDDVVLKGGLTEFVKKNEKMVWVKWSRKTEPVNY